ncbi:hypothetical protein MCUN1_002642 [Malassezia cuniculi]|uniref:CUE domain-containing protein n=1 Tax=Malassezia cuniculi TaxID=948313 RepID=A0AAF0EVF3_9BASI|nr:hypothetical protein MCUN1_002642 [Malassezia cuniculi]
MSESAGSGQPESTHAAVAPVHEHAAEGIVGDKDTQGLPEVPPRPAVASLLAMFPEMDRTTIETVLDAHVGDANAAVTVLLSMCDPEYHPTQQDEHAVHNAELARRMGNMHLNAPQTQSWDPQKLTYQPRVRRPRVSSGTFPQPSVGGHAGEYSSLQNIDFREYESRLANAAAEGMARVGSKLSQLRHRAETTIKNLPESGMKQRIQDSALFRKPSAGAPDRHSRARTQMNQAGLSGSMYDNDPQMVGELDLDQLLAAPLPIPNAHKDKKNNWGQRYSRPESSSVRHSNLPTEELEGWDAVGRESDDEAPQAPEKDDVVPVEEAKKPEVDTPPAAPTKDDAASTSKSEQSQPVLTHKSEKDDAATPVEKSEKGVAASLAEGKHSKDGDTSALAAKPTNDNAASAAVPQKPKAEDQDEPAKHVKPDDATHALDKTNDEPKDESDREYITNPFEDDD